MVLHVDPGLVSALVITNNSSVASCSSTIELNSTDIVEFAPAPITESINSTDIVKWTPALSSVSGRPKGSPTNEKIDNARRKKEATDIIAV